MQHPCVSKPHGEHFQPGDTTASGEHSVCWCAPGSRGLLPGSHSSLQACVDTKHTPPTCRAEAGPQCPPCRCTPPRASAEEGTAAAQGLVPQLPLLLRPRVASQSPADRQEARVHAQGLAAGPTGAVQQHRGREKVRKGTPLGRVQLHAMHWVNVRPA